MSTDYGSPILALGSYRPVGQVESGGVRLGPFAVRAAVHTGIGYNDNVTLSSTNKQSSLFYTLSPSVSVGLEGASQRYYAVYRGNYGAYASGGGVNYAEHNFGLIASNDWTTRLRSLLRYEFVRGHDPRGSTGTAISDSNVWNVNALRGTVSYGAPGAMGRVEGTVGYTNKEYVSNRALTATQDFERFETTGTFSWRVAPKTRALVEIQRADITHKADPLLDSVEMRYLVGAVWEATAKTTGTVRAGYSTRDPEAATAPDFSGFTYEASVTWSPLTYSNFTFGAVRTLNEASDVGSSFVVDTVGTVAWTHGWSDRVSSSANVIYGQQEHEGIGRTDTFYGLGLRASYAFQRRFRIGAELRHDSRSSSLSVLESKRNLTLLTLEAAL